MLQRQVEKLFQVKDRVRNICEELDKMLFGITYIQPIQIARFILYVEKVKAGANLNIYDLFTVKEGDNQMMKIAEEGDEEEVDQHVQQMFEKFKSQYPERKEVEELPVESFGSIFSPKRFEDFDLIDFSLGEKF